MLRGVMYVMLRVKSSSLSPYLTAVFAAYESQLEHTCSKRLPSAASVSVSTLCRVCTPKQATSTFHILRIQQRMVSIFSGAGWTSRSRPSTSSKPDGSIRVNPSCKGCGTLLYLTLAASARIGHSLGRHPLLTDLRLRPQGLERLEAFLCYEMVRQYTFA